MLSLALRIELSAVNYQDNDNHFQVIQIITYAGRIPRRQDCWQCYAPKLYHQAAAILIKTTGIGDLKRQYALAKAISLLSGAATIMILYRYLTENHGHTRACLAAFSLTALNPKHISINAQATNDSFAIFLTTLMLYYFIKYLKSEKTTHFAASATLSILAMQAKATALPAIAAASLTLLAKTLSTKSKTRAGIALAILVAATGINIFMLGQYGYNAREYGNPLRLNRDTLPISAKPGYSRHIRPGFTSIRDSLSTFMFTDLLKHPRITHGVAIEPAHRTSLWSQLYGRANFAQFDSWPPIWQTQDEKTMLLGRMIFLLALLPAALLAAGALKTLQKTRENQANTLLILTTAAYLAFIAGVSALYRDFAIMKAIFLYPGILAYADILHNGINYAEKKAGKKTVKTVFAILSILTILYSLSITALISAVTP